MKFAKHVIKAKRAKQKMENDFDGKKNVEVNEDN